jgi:hypothetical protein
MKNISRRRIRKKRNFSGFWNLEEKIEKSITELPYIITIKNLTSKDIKEVDVINYDYKKEEKKIEYSMNSHSVAYDDFLRLTSCSNPRDPIKIGLMYIQSANGAQPFQTLYIIESYPNGGFKGVPITPMLDPMQQQGGVTIVRHYFDISFTTDIVIANLLANAAVTFRFYPTPPTKLKTKPKSRLKRFMQYFQYKKK